jgi:hypothetical protein
VRISSSANIIYARLNYKPFNLIKLYYKRIRRKLLKIVSKIIKNKGIDKLYKIIIRKGFKR